MEVSLDDEIMIGASHRQLRKLTTTTNAAKTLYPTSKGWVSICRDIENYSNPDAGKAYWMKSICERHKRGRGEGGKA